MKPTLKHINKILGTEMGGTPKVSKRTGIRTIKLWNKLHPLEIAVLQKTLPAMFPDQSVSFTEKTVIGACEKPVTCVLFAPKA